MKLTKKGEEILFDHNQRLIPLRENFQKDFTDEDCIELKKYLKKLRTILEKNVKTQI